MGIINNFYLKSPEKIEEFIKDNEKTIEIINAIEPQLIKYFPIANTHLKSVIHLDGQQKPNYY